jgi:dGTPase
VGEEALDAAYRIFDPTARFRHYEHSLRIVDELENGGRGLNLTWEVRDGILHHSKGKSDLLSGQSLDKWLQKGKPSTLEGQVIRICDRVAYVNHDIDDAIRAGFIVPEDIPADCTAVLGRSHSARITTMVCAIIEASSELVAGKDGPVRQAAERISKRDDDMEATDKLKNWMFQQVYLLNSGDEEPRVRHVIEHLFRYYMMHPQLMKSVSCPVPSGKWEDLSQAQLARCVCDYVAGMTDRYASQSFAEAFMPTSWHEA